MLSLITIKLANWLMLSQQCSQSLNEYVRLSVWIGFDKSLLSHFLLYVLLSQFYVWGCRL